jgi:hypothetical protein
MLKLCKMPLVVECCYAECRIFILMLSVIMLSVIMLSVIIVSVVMLNAIAPTNIACIYQKNISLEMKKNSYERKLHGAVTFSRMAPNSQQNNIQ